MTVLNSITPQNTFPHEIEYLILSSWTSDSLKKPYVSYLTPSITLESAHPTKRTAESNMQMNFFIFIPSPIQLTLDRKSNWKGSESPLIPANNSRTLIDFFFFFLSNFGIRFCTFPHLSYTHLIMNLSPFHLIWTTLATLVLSHFGANYLRSITPRGYWFWFTILNIFFWILFM